MSFRITNGLLSVEGKTFAIAIIELFVGGDDSPINRKYFINSVNGPCDVWTTEGQASINATFLVNYFGIDFSTCSNIQAV